MRKRKVFTKCLSPIFTIIAILLLYWGKPITVEAATPSHKLEVKNLTINSAQVWDTMSSSVYVYSDYLYLSTDYNAVANHSNSALYKSETTKMTVKYLYWTLNNLTPNTTYYYRFAYKSSSYSGYTYSGISSFTTSLPATVGYSAWGANTITDSSVHIYANLPSTIDVKKCTGLVWEETGVQSIVVYSKTDVISKAMYFWYDVTGLKPSTKYGWSITYTDQYGRDISVSGSFTTEKRNTNSWLWPTPIYNGISQAYSSSHHGVDVKASYGADVLAAKAGEVIAVVNDCSHEKLTYEHRGECVHYVGNIPVYYGGNMVIIKHDDGTYSQYAHMIKGSVSVSIGQKVYSGQKIGSVGYSGQATGAHIHFDVYKSSTGNWWNCQYFDPMSLQWTY